MSAHRRSLMTATAAGTVLCALWFVPSAKATPEWRDADGGQRHAASPESEVSTATASGTPRAGEDGGDGLTAPFVLSALGLAGTGGALIVRARLRQSAGSRA